MDDSKLNTPCRNKTPVTMEDQAPANKPLCSTGGEVAGAAASFCKASSADTGSAPADVPLSLLLPLCAHQNCPAARHSGPGAAGERPAALRCSSKAAASVQRTLENAPNLPAPGTRSGAASLHPHTGPAGSDRRSGAAALQTAVRCCCSFCSAVSVQQIPPLKSAPSFQPPCEGGSGSNPPCSLPG